MCENIGTDDSILTVRKMNSHCTFTILQGVLFVVGLIAVERRTS